MNITKDMSREEVINIYASRVAAEQPIFSPEDETDIEERRTTRHGDRRPKSLSRRMCDMTNRDRASIHDLTYHGTYTE